MQSAPIEWDRLGLVVRPSGDWWMRTHAMVPTPESLEGSLIRVYFSGRSRDNRSHVGWVVIDLESPTRVLEAGTQPVLSPGELGTFDDAGVTPSCLTRVGDRTLLYYVGWNPGSTVRVHLFGGVAVRHGELFERVSRAPIIERSAIDPFLNTAPFVVESQGLIMYYVAGVGWDHPNLPRYHIKYARSIDGISWERDRDWVALDFADRAETALARPFVLRDEGLLRMWFSTKRTSYAIGYAESIDGINWSRSDEHAGLSPSSGGWDSQMVEYGAVVKYDGRHFLFYNGNDYGQDGFGLAVSK